MLCGVCPGWLLESGSSPYPAQLLTMFLGTLTYAVCRVDIIYNPLQIFRAYGNDDRLSAWPYLVISIHPTITSGPCFISGLVPFSWPKSVPLLAGWLFVVVVGGQWGACEGGGGGGEHAIQSFPE